jgi:hypothetical protein
MALESAPGEMRRSFAALRRCPASTTVAKYLSRLISIRKQLLHNNVFYKIYNQTGGLLRSVNYAQNSQTGDFIQICTDAERISRIEISFGDSLYAGEWTDLTLNRFISAINGNYENWVGFMTSTVNQ